MSHTSRMHSYYNSFLARINLEKANRKSIRMERILRIKLRIFSSSRTTSVEAIYFQEILKQTDSLFFVSNSPFARSIGLMSKNLKAIMYLALRTTNTKYLEYYNFPFVLELIHLHSFKKGEGRKLMEAFLKIQRNLKIPGSLWVETSEIVSYYEKYGFKNLGKLGSNSEFLMILPVETETVK